MSSIHINKVKNGLKEIANLGKEEETFEIRGQEITLKTLTPTEKEKAERRCQPILSEAQEKDDFVLMQRWLNRLKIEMLSYSIIEIGDVNFRGIDEIETDRVDPDTGEAIKLEKHIYLRQFLENWNEEAVNITFKKFRELTERTERELNDEVEFEEEDLDVKIEKKKEELRELEREKREKEDSELEEEERFIQEKTGNSISKEDLKDEFYSPVSEEEIEERGEETQEQREVVEQSELQAQSQSQTRTQQQKPQTGTSQTGQSRSGQQGEVEYVDEEGNPLKGQELERAKELDKQLQKKKNQEMEAEREPLNQTQAEVREGEFPAEESRNKPKRNAQKASNPVNKEDLPISDTFSDMEPETLTEGNAPEPRDLSDVETDPTPQDE